MAGSSPTIKDVATKAGVSYSAVSRAINGKKGVKPDLRKRILRVATEMNYFPHSSAKALVQKRIGVVGVVIQRTSEFAFQNPFFSQVLMGVSSIVNSRNYQLLLSINDQVDLASLYYRRQVDGLIVLANRVNDEKLKQLFKDGIPVVSVPGFPDGKEVDIPSVNSENFHSLYLGVNYLIELGHRRIAFIIGKRDSWYSIERLTAFEKAFKDNNLIFDENLIKESDFSKPAGFRLMGELLDLPQPPTSVICINDSITPGALHQINRRNLMIPRDISVLAIGCSDVYELFTPPLTTIKTPAVDIGKIATSRLIEIVEEGAPTSIQTIIPSDLIIRESTGKCHENY